MNEPDQIPQTARDYLALMAKGALTSELLVKHCLDAIEATDEKLQAWESVDRDKALEQARDADSRRISGRATGPLQGLPIGLKDIFDTAELPTQCGTEICKGRQPEADCAVVEKLREAGAVILGKTVTTEFAFMHEARTRNPHNLDHGPGGSSSGSAAAVAAGQVPVAFGSQTGGSTIRPASYCGVFGYKPSRGIISRRGVLPGAPSLDQIGLFARDLGDLALLTDVVGAYDAADPQSFLAPRPNNLKGYESEPPVPPVFAWFDMPYAERYSQSTAEGCGELIDELGDQVDRLEAPRSFQGLLEAHRLIYRYELVREFQSIRAEHEADMSDTLREALSEGDAISDALYAEAKEAEAAATSWFAELFTEYDAVLTPAATGEAPRFGDGTGDPVCNTLWTLCGLPCLSLPILQGENALPIGVQLVGGREEDDRLFRTARWLLQRLS